MPKACYIRCYTILNRLLQAFTLNSRESGSMTNTQNNITNIWRASGFHDSIIGKKNKPLSLIQHFCHCVKWTYQRAAKGYCDSDVWEMFSYLQTLLPNMLQEFRDTHTGAPFSPW